LEKPKAGIDWNKYKAGSIVKGTVTKVEEFGVILSLDAKVNGFAHLKQVAGKAEVGSEVECVVLDVDKMKSIVDVSIRTELLNQVRGNDSSKAAEPLKKDKQVDAVVELIKANYLILSLVRTYQPLSYSFANNVFRAESTVLETSRR
jgi:ribosomal protein S1